jgi:hypothetical protein
LTLDTSVLVLFEESESVTSAGTTTVRYQVLYERVWSAPQKLPLAKSEMLPNAPSILWRRQVTVPLALGTKVERVITRPERGQGSTADVLLGKKAGLRQQSRRIALLVGPKGALIPA